jgi:hypothetical protein
MPMLNLDKFNNENGPGKSKRCTDQLRWQPILDAAEIGVSVKNGIVTLSGLVNSILKTGC